MLQKAVLSVMAAFVAVSGLSVPAAAEEEADPTAIEAEARQHFALAEQYRGSKLWENAASEYEKGLELQPGNSDAYARLGYVLTEAGEYDKAVGVLREFIDREPDVCRGYDSLGYTFLKQAHEAEEAGSPAEKGFLDEAVAAYTTGIERCPDDVDLQLSLARAQLKAENPDAALVALERMREVAPDDPRSYELLGNQYYDAERFPESIEAYEALLALPNHGKAQNWLDWAAARIAFMYRKTEQYEKAIPYYRQVLTRSPEDLRSLDGIALAYDRTGQTELAVDAYEKLVKIEPEKSAYYYRLGQLLFDLGDYQKAVSRLKKGLRYEMDCSAKAHYLLGESQEKLENYQAARREFERSRDCGDPVFTEKAVAQIERQTQLMKIEKAKAQLEAEG